MLKLVKPFALLLITTSWYISHPNCDIDDFWKENFIFKSTMFQYQWDPETTVIAESKLLGNEKQTTAVERGRERERIIENILTFTNENTFCLQKNRQCNTKSIEFLFHV